MGTDTLATRTDGQTIDQNWFNVLKSILTGNQVPRNAAGSAETAAGSLGTDTYRYSNLFVSGSGSANIGDAIMEVNSGKLRLKDSATGSAFVVSERLNNINNLITLTGSAADSVNLGTFAGTIIRDNATIREALVDVETELQDFKSERSFNYYNDAELTWGDTPTSIFSTSITIPAGKKVMFRCCFESKDTGLYRAYWYRDSTQLTDYTYAGQNSSGAYKQGTNGSHPDMYLTYIDNPGAGTYTYSLRRQRGDVDTHYCKGFYLEAFLIPA